MSKVWRQTFAVWQEDRERDERYQRLMQVHLYPCHGLLQHELLDSKAYPRGPDCH